MKKMFVMGLVLAMVAGFSGVSMAASIVASSHDLTSVVAGVGEICVFCHVPHNPTDNVSAPLWNRTMNDITYTDYYGTAGQTASGVSKLCLSCHDGVTNLDAFGSPTATGTAGNDLDTLIPATNAVVGTDLQDDHPVMIAYPAAQAGKFKADPGDAGAVARTFAGQVECASCHNPHDSGDSADLQPFLRASNTNSGLCLACHDK